MSKSKKWKMEWSFFLDSNGRRKYNDLCRRCARPCRQSFRAEIVTCPFYTSRKTYMAEKCCDKG